MIMEGCQGKPKLSIMEKNCPQCGSEIEIFSVDTEAVCENCGFVIYNDTLTCVKWCSYARKCMGDEAYESLMKVAQRVTSMKCAESAEA
jgi:hypothetical protein